MPLTGEYAPSKAEWVRKQVAKFEASGGAEANKVLGRPIVVITSRGAKSGSLRKNPVVRVEKDGVYAAVASAGGKPENPEWVHNFLADPHVELQDGAEPADYVARLAEGEEREEWWDFAVGIFPQYAEYQKKTERQIPLFLLERA